MVNGWADASRLIQSGYHPKEKYSVESRLPSAFEGYAKLRTDKPEVYTRFAGKMNKNYLKRRENQCTLCSGAVTKKLGTFFILLRPVKPLLKFK